MPPKVRVVIPTYYNVRSLWNRRASTIATVLGLALVVFVFAAVLMLSNGIEEALRSGGRPDNAVLLRAGATAEISSVVERADVRILATFPEVAQSKTGDPLVVGEVVVLVALPREAGGFINATVRGVEPGSFEARPGVQIVEGRAPTPGTNEIAIGGGLVGRFKGAFVGGELELARSRWPIVGRIVADGGAFESELWTDREKLARAYERTAFSSALVALRSPGELDALEARVGLDRRFSLKVQREDRYWEEAASGTATFIRILGLFVSVVFSGGAVLGAMITMDAQVAARTRELAMMRAIGFPKRSVLLGILLESALLGAAGGVLGAAFATAMKLVQIRTLNFQTFAEVRFGFEPTAGILLGAIAFGVAMGTVGGLLPAYRASRLPILEATRA